jgi:hypothetical protein
MDEQKKHWEKPVLVVIGRGKPEERVLASCKPTTATGLITPGNTQCKGGGQQLGNCLLIGS